MEHQKYLLKLHSELLSIMLKVDQVCEENKLKYYLVGGSLLGAIRHNGFIPWDDDLDIAMPRDDFDRFISIADQQLSPNYELQWITTNNEYWQVFAKVVKKGTLFKEPSLKKFSSLGIFIDIFPLDLAPQYSSKLEKKKRQIRRINSIIWAKNSARYDFKHLPSLILSKFISTTRLQKVMCFIMQSTKKSGATHYVNFGSQYRLAKQTMPIEWYGDGVRHQFEGYSFIIPTESVKVLSSIYGANYMDLPPENKRRCHYPEKILFSDGEVMTFDKPAHIVTVREQENY